jgi:hypothetical protein
VCCVKGGELQLREWAINVPDLQFKETLSLSYEMKEKKKTAFYSTGELYLPRLLAIQNNNLNNIFKII